jgi:hypothetical protein
MRPWMRLVAAPAALAAAALAFVATRGGAAEDVTLIGGTYVGNVMTKFTPITPEGLPAKNVDAATLEISQDVESLTATLTVQTDAGPKMYNLGGKFGEERFWLYGNSPDGQVILSGKVLGNLPKITLKGDGRLVGPTGILDIRFVVKPGVI